MSLKSLYQPSLALLTDLYQLTMAYGYWKTGTANKETVFNLFFRRNPFKGNFTIACGLATVVDYLEQFRFDTGDLAYLSSLTGNDDLALFDSEFLDYLGAMSFQCDVDAIPEGTVVFPHQPLLRIRGPILQCQLLETALLNIINFQTLIATKASRVVTAAAGDPVLEFGLRRAQGIDGALSASYAAWIGGCAATSNVLAGKLFGIPVKGTHAHSWIMSFDEELTAFQAYAEAMPNNCVFLVDTYDTLEGVRRAVEVGKQLQSQGHQMVGIRLDSGDLADLSIKARSILDEAGFTHARIVASNDLDEYEIVRLKEKGAKICMWGVGTRLVTAHDQPALGGVYKLSAMRQGQGPWTPTIKLSEEKIKTSIPGQQQVCRFTLNGQPVADVIYQEDTGLNPPKRLYPLDGSPAMTLADQLEGTNMLEPLFRGGKKIAALPDGTKVRERAMAQTRLFAKYFKEQATYTVGLDGQLFELREQLIQKSR